MVLLQEFQKELPEKSPKKPFEGPKELFKESRKELLVISKEIHVSQNHKKCPKGTLKKIAKESSGKSQGNLLEEPQDKYR